MTDDITTQSDEDPNADPVEAPDDAHPAVPPEDDASAPPASTAPDPSTIAPEVPGGTVETTPPAVTTGVDNSPSEPTEADLRAKFDEHAAKRG
jgi:hypothetical protein